MIFKNTATATIIGLFLLSMYTFKAIGEERMLPNSNKLQLRIKKLFSL